jgi:aryl-alcohol dehydrogenase-like predicted oxidoreductase
MKRTRTIAGTEVGAIGLGGMPMSLQGRPPTEQAVATIHAALDAGVALIDTADAYCQNADDTGHNERLIAEALRSWGGPRHEVMVATKGGHVRDAAGSWLLDGRPEHLRAACDASLVALGVDVIDLYQFHRPDPKVPFAESMGAMAELRDAGKVRLVGVSNVNIDQLEEASAIVPLASVQNQFSPAFRSSDEELAWCTMRDVAFLPWSPLGGMGGAAGLADRFPAFADVAENHGVSPQQVALAWELAQSDVVIPIPGASRPASIVDSVGAADLDLSVDELAALSMDLGT